jgi:gamma-glutamyltranspeptidase
MESAADYMLAPLQDMGHPVSAVDLNSGMTAIQIDQNKLLIGAADPRREGTAAGK